ncbi:MAG: YggS family pyridoxal phosphate-dependent enzyme [Alkalinema sp. RU_4_3]|nr:YggS family pyridoxal phosphate-dependent enzyme [Alkalinema sp. RU_4_3]
MSSAAPQLPSPEAFDRLTEHIQTFRAAIPQHVRIVAVTKTLPAWMIRAAYAVGIRDVGENRIQEAIAKRAELQDLPDITWHYIGHLQSNKAQKALDSFDWIQSVDSLALAQRLNRLAIARSAKPNICLQVKLLDDPAKSGWTVPDLQRDLAALGSFKNLNIRGLMVIAPYGLSTADLTKLFCRAQKLHHQLADSLLLGSGFTELSMGMSGDYGVAIAQGSTMIRPGQVLFGERQG